MDEQAVVTAAEVARLAGVGRAAVGNWRRRYADFPAPVAGTESSPSFRLVEVHSWLRSNGRIGAHAAVELAWQELESATSSESAADVLGAVGTYLTSGCGDLSTGLRSAVDDLVAEVGEEIAFEQLCGRYVEATSRQLAVTPASLASLMIELAEVGVGPVLDPACGTGTILREADPEVEVLGQELDPGLVALARARLAFTHRTFRVELGDSLREDSFEDTLAAAVVCNPPFNVRAWGREDLQYDPRWVYGLPAKGESELAWVQHCMARVRVGGKVVIVLPPGVAFRRTGRPVRAALVRRGALRAVISLPAGAVAPAHLRMQLWVLSTDGADPANAVRFVDLCAGSVARLEEIGWEDVGRRLRRALGGDEDPALQRLVPAIDLLDDDVDLSPTRYLDSQPATADIDGDRERLLDLLGGLRDSLPRLVTVDGSRRPPRTTIGDLAKQGALTITQQRAGGLEDGGAAPVLTSRDVVEGRGPSGTAEYAADAVWLEAGDVVVPTVVSRPVAYVAERDVRALLGPGLQLLRVVPEVLDPQFLAGALRSEQVARLSSTMSGRHRVDVRRVEVTRLPLAEQRRFGQTLAALQRFSATLDEVLSLGRGLTQALIDAVVDGDLEPDGV